MVEADLVPRRMDLAVDGTVHKSHASGRGWSIRGEEKKEESPVTTAASEGEKSGEAEKKKQAGKLSSPKKPESENTKSKPKKKAKGPRYCSDPSATWRYSNGSHSLEYGHLGIAGMTRVGKQDIPLFTGFARSHRGETPETMRLLWVWAKEMREMFPEYGLRSVIGDAGYDAAAFYIFVQEQGASPIIAQGKTPLPKPLEKESERGLPLCEGGAEMKYHSRAVYGNRYQCPAMRLKRKEGGGSGWEYEKERCPLGHWCKGDNSEVKSGPFRVVALATHPRRPLSVPRDSEAFGTRYNKRTSVERHFSHLHQKVEDRSYRRLHLWQLASALHLMNQQAEAVRRQDPNRFAGFWRSITGGAAAAPAA